jgi:protein involved in polysaccharide export with SLBB domain
MFQGDPLLDPAEAVTTRPMSPGRQPEIRPLVQNAYRAPAHSTESATAVPIVPATASLPGADEATENSTVVVVLQGGSVFQSTDDGNNQNTNQGAPPGGGVMNVPYHANDGSAARRPAARMPGGEGPVAAPTIAMEPAPPNNAPLPVELCKASLPPYIVEPPDILLIDTVRMIPLPPYRIEPLDILLVQVTPTLPNQPISGAFTVTPDGTINLGYVYGLVRVAGLTLEEAQVVLRTHLTRAIQNPQVAVALAQSRTIQQVRGEHLVRPDGTISLGTYGCVYVAGMTLAQAKAAIERYLSQFVQNPEISLDVAAYNSKVYYVIADGAGYGQQVYRFPATGNETVLDAISNIGGIPIVGSKRNIWVARPSPPYRQCYQILPVDWEAITLGGATETNYQIFPGDRIYIKSDCLIRFDNMLAKIISPVERLFGVTLLGSATVQSFRNTNGNNGIFTGF